MHRKSFLSSYNNHMKHHELMESSDECQHDNVITQVPTTWPGVHISVPDGSETDDPPSLSTSRLSDHQTESKNQDNDWRIVYTVVISHISECSEHLGTFSEFPEENYHL